MRRPALSSGWDVLQSSHHSVIVGVLIDNGSASTTVRRQMQHGSHSSSTVGEHRFSGEVARPRLAPTRHGRDRSCFYFHGARCSRARPIQTGAGATVYCLCLRRSCALAHVTRALVRERSLLGRCAARVLGSARPRARRANIVGRIEASRIGVCRVRRCRACRDRGGRCRRCDVHRSRAQSVRCMRATRDILLL